MTTPHTPPAAPDLAAIEARAAAATRGPWHADHEFGHVNASALGPSHIVCGLDSELCADTGGADIAFIAHAREDVPALLRHLAAQQAAHAAALDAAVAAERERHAAEVAAARAEALREFAHRAEQGAVDTARIDRALATIDALTRERDRLAADLARLRAPLTGALAAIEARAAAARADELDRRFNRIAYTLREDPAASGERWSVCRVCEAEGDDPHDPGCPVGHVEGRAALQAQHAAEVARAVAGERERAVAVCRAVADGWERASVTAKVDTGLALIRAEGATECADALAAPTGGGE